MQCLILQQWWKSVENERKKVEKIVPASAVTQLPMLLIRKDGNIKN